MRYAGGALLLLLTTGCATLPKTYEWNWVRVWNQATTTDEMERAVALMEKNDYVRYSGQVIRNYVNPNASSTPVTDLEREVLYFRMASQYLWEWQARGENRERAEMYARKLHDLPNPHTMSQFLYARVQELAGGSYNKHLIPVPEGMGMWFFSVGGASNQPTEIAFGDFKAEYEKILSEKKGGSLGRGTQAACAAVLLCFLGVNSDEDLVVQDLKRNVYLDVSDKQGAPVKIGVSSWLASSR